MLFLTLRIWMWKAGTHRLMMGKESFSNDIILCSLIDLAVNLEKSGRSARKFLM